MKNRNLSSSKATGDHNNSFIELTDLAFLRYTRYSVVARRQFYVAHVEILYREHKRVRKSWTGRLPNTNDISINIADYLLT